MSTWKTRALSEVCEFTNGLWKGERPPFVNVGVIRNTNFTKEGALDDSDIAYLDVEAKKFEKRRLRFGDIILEKSGGGPKQPVGRVVLFDKPDGDFSFSNFTAAIRVRDPKEIHFRFLHKFLHWIYLTGATEDMQSNSTGIRNLHGDRYEAIQIKFPELLEQQRIVNVLDQASERIATARANTERNLHSSRALFESHLQSVFSPPNASWERVTLETLLERGWIESHLDGNHGSEYPRKEEFIAEGIPYISANCLDDERVDMTRAKFLSPSRALTIRKGIAKDRDVLFAHNATVGPVAILGTHEEKVILGTSLTYYRCNPANILPEYLAHYMRSFAFKTQYLQLMRQSTRNQVPITKQREFFHIIPPVAEQQRIIGALNEIFEKGKRLRSICQQKAMALEALKKSLFHQAFMGEL
ncbi:MAG: restriction endonuclease subunit S [Myxococcales bacterium]|nr:MAG: restriction endonuclease subunit S [Myxococcales bacterium]